jgi:alpha-glucosidase (family GH31 glycosyl hydrolase)
LYIDFHLSQSAIHLFTMSPHPETADSLPSFVSTAASLRLRRILLGACVLIAGLPLQPYASDSLRFANAPCELRITQISDRMIRLQLSPLDSEDQPIPAPASTDLVPFKSIEKLRTRGLTSEKVIRAGQLRLVIRPDPLTISLHTTTPKNRLVQQLTFKSANGPTNFILFHTDAPVFGLGEGGPQFDRRGSLYRMINGQLTLLATHGATIPVPFLIGTDGWAMFVQSPWGELDLRGPTGRFIPRSEALAREPIDVFLIAADRPADVMAEFIRLTGHPVMPPKWTMGYLQSHRTLCGPDEPLEIARTFREKQLPCDALIYLGTGYCTNGWNTGHGSLEFNPNAFPHPADQINALHELNFKVILHINHAPRNLFGTTFSPSSSSAVAASPSEDFTSPLHIGNYWARHRPDFALGVDGWWPDDGDELPIEARLARHRCYYEGPLTDRPNIRPWSLHRNGYAGAARYGGWIWSGDTQSRWATLAAHVPVALNYSLSLTPFWGSDTGGFVATPELTGELYARWFQFSAFNPIFRSHGRTWHLRLPWGWNTGEYGPIETPGRPDPSELHNAAIEPICKRYLDLRYRLLPYNYTLMREACDTGLPPMRALWVHYPRDPEAVKLGDQYLWGRDLLIAPVVEKGAASRRLYLPAGEWFDWWTGEKLSGSRWIQRPVDLATMPIYVRAGAIIPLDPVRQYTAQTVSEPTTLTIYPGANGSFTLYDDDGSTLDYQRNVATWTVLRWNDKTRALTLEPSKSSSSSYSSSSFRSNSAKPAEPAARLFQLHLAGSSSQKTIVYSGKKIDASL